MQLKGTVTASRADDVVINVFGETKDCSRALTNRAAKTSMM